MTQGERVKELRKTLKLTLDKFGEKLCVTKQTISRIENGVNNLTDQMAKAICREFNVNETWLRTGDGEMFIEMTRDEEIAAFVGRTLRDEDDSFRKRFVAALAALDIEEWEVLEKMVKLLEKEKE